MSKVLENIERDEDLRCKVIGELAIELDTTYAEAEAIHNRNVMITRLLRLENKLDRIAKIIG